MIVERAESVLFVRFSRNWFSVFSLNLKLSWYYCSFTRWLIFVMIMQRAKWILINGDSWNRFFFFWMHLFLGFLTTSPVFNCFCEYTKGGTKCENRVCWNRLPVSSLNVDSSHFLGEISSCHLRCDFTTGGTSVNIRFSWSRMSMLF